MDANNQKILLYLVFFLQMSVSNKHLQKINKLQK